ncbi:MAG: hypothetical protein U5O39_05490 [Gammaproteobacteria bacterium]|nr:hypothetical protein [Gammaproteobacteria bacterium]
MDTSKSPRSEFDVPVVTEPARYGRWASAAAVLLLLYLLARAFYTNPFIDYPVIGEYLFHPVILKGVWVTITLAIAAQVLSTVLGFISGADVHIEKSRPQCRQSGVRRGL